MYKITLPNENKTYELVHSLDVYSIIKARQKELKLLKGEQYVDASASLDYIKNHAKEYHLGLDLKVEYKSFHGVDTIVVYFPKHVALNQIQQILKLSGYSLDDNNVITNCDGLATYCHTHVFIQCNELNKKLIINRYINL